jgi:hypothetical protein
MGLTACTPCTVGGSAGARSWMILRWRGVFLDRVHLFSPSAKAECASPGKARAARIAPKEREPSSNLNQSRVPLAERQTENRWAMSMQVRCSSGWQIWTIAQTAGRGYPRQGGAKTQNKAANALYPGIAGGLTHALSTRRAGT